MPSKPKPSGRPGTATTHNAARTREMRTFTLSKEAIRWLDAMHEATGESRSAVVDALILTAKREVSRTSKKAT